MNILAIILWSGLILLLCAAIVLALVASGKGRHWLVVPCVVFVGIAIVWSVLGGATTAPGFGFQVAAGIGLLVLGVVAGSPLVTLILELAGSGAVALGDHGGIMVTDDSPSPERREILRGGMTIALVVAAALAQIGEFSFVLATLWRLSSPSRDSADSPSWRTRPHESASSSEPS